MCNWSPPNPRNKFIWGRLLCPMCWLNFMILLWMPTLCFCFVLFWLSLLLSFVLFSINKKTWMEENLDYLSRRGSVFGQEFTFSSEMASRNLNVPPTQLINLLAWFDRKSWTLPRADNLSCLTHHNHLWKYQKWKPFPYCSDSSFAF